MSHSRNEAVKLKWLARVVAGLEPTMFGDRITNPTLHAPPHYTLHNILLKFWNASSNFNPWKWHKILWIRNSWSNFYVPLWQTSSSTLKRYRHIMPSIPASQAASSSELDFRHQNTTVPGFSRCNHGSRQIRLKEQVAATSSMTMQHS
jgi:hypothetical protein